jgi:hypothetical protein
MSSKGSDQLSELSSLEMKKIRELRSISSSLDSPDLGVMYTAAGKLMSYPIARSLLPKTMSLLDTSDATLRRLMYRTAGRNVYGYYIPELFKSMSTINPAEREQVLQGIEELFETSGSPSSSDEQKKWIAALETTGREHQPTVFGIMASLGSAGATWATKRVKNRIETIAYGTVPKLLSFPETKRKKLIQTLCEESARKRPELLPYIGGIMDHSSIKLLAPFLKKGSWQDRVEVAKAVGRIGITSTTGIVMEIVADPEWRVKQALLEAIDISSSKLSSLISILSYLVADSHSRVRGQAERTMLLMGNTPCAGSTLETQRKRVEKQFRQHLLKAAGLNLDVDSKWLGVEIEEDPIPYISETADGPEGVSLLDLQPETEQAEEPTGKLDLMAALLKARSQASAEPEPEEEPEVEFTENIESAKTLPNTDKFLLLLKQTGGHSARGVSLTRLKKEASSLEMSEAELEEALSELEKDGIVYRSSKGTVKRVDIEL